jgi:4-amino-4-deoxy-L-arabinose transferase-like glycosyltransferase
LLWGVPLAVVVSAIWYGPVIARHGWLFVDEFFIQHHFARYVSNKYHHPQPIYFYPAIILMLALPWTAFLIEALAKVRRWTWRGSDELSIVRVFSLAWLAMPIVFFSFSGSKLPGYILPALPAAAFLIADRFIDSISKWPLRATGAICFILAAGGFVYALQSKQITILCATLIAAPLLAAAVASWAKPNERPVALALICGSTFVLVMVVSICAAPAVGRRESVKDLLQLADVRGYASAPVLAQRSDDRSAQFYAHDRVVYNAEGEPITFDEVTLAQARALGERIVVFIPLEYADNFKNAGNMEFFGDNGRLAVFGWKP